MTSGFEMMITFACVNVGNYQGRGAEYVNKLYTSISRNYPDLFKFVCFTDDPKGLHMGVRPIATPDNVKGWWNKLYMFKAGHFKPGSKIVYFDLDTLITGELDFLSPFSGAGGEEVQFAILDDFLKKDTYGPGMMMWTEGVWREIWENYDLAGYPTDMKLGDLTWINKLFNDAGYKPQLLQELYPGKICSYKKHARLAIPPDVSVVCFHGLPRPHEALGWAKEHWDGA
jgi:hypothetical protein